MADSPDDPTVVPIKRGPGGRTSGTRYGNGVGKGPGWGGPPRGSGAAQFGAGNKAAAGPRDRLKQEEKERVREEMLAKIYALAHDAERQETQLSAAQAMLDRIDGRPVNKNLNVNTDDVNKLSDAELMRIARGGLTSEPASDGETVN